MAKLVYLVTGPTGLHYVGIIHGAKQTVAGRWREHCSGKARGPLERAIRAHGPAAFSIAVIDTARTTTELQQKERLYVAVFDSYCNGYNGTPGGDITPLEATMAAHNRPDTRAKHAAVTSACMNNPLQKALRTARSKAATFELGSSIEYRQNCYRAQLITLRAKHYHDPEWLERHPLPKPEPVWLWEKRDGRWRIKKS